MLAMTAWFSGMTHSPNRIRSRAILMVASTTGRMRCTSQIVACSSSVPPASTSAVSRVSRRGCLRSRSNGPRQRRRRGLVARGEQREQFVGDVAVGDRRPVLVARLQHEGEHVVAVLERRIVPWLRR